MGRDFIFVAISLFFWGLGESSFQPFQTLYLQQFGASPIYIGTILGLYGIASSIAHIPAGFLADRIGRRPMIWAAWFLGLCATLIMALASSIVWFVIGMLLYGLTLFVLAPLNSYVTVARGNLSIGRALTLISASYNTGAIVGPILGGAIGSNYNYRTIFQFSAVLFLISTIFILFIRPQSIEDTFREETDQKLFKNSAYIKFLVLFAFATFAMFISQPLSPNFLLNERSVSLISIGRLYSIGGIGIVMLNIFLGHLPPWRGYLLGQLLVGIFALLLWIGNGVSWYSIAFLGLGGFRVSRSLATAHIQSLVRSNNIGLAFGLAETATAVSTMFAPLLAGLLYEQNPEWIYTSGIILILISVCLSCVNKRPNASTFLEI